MTDQKVSGFSTRQLHVGTSAAPATPRALPIHLTAGFTFDSFEQGVAHFGEGTGYGYTRIGNPTIDAVEAKLADLEGGTRALLVGSGQAAVSTAILALAGAGDHIVSSTHIYEGSRGLFLDLLPRLGISITFVDDIANVEAWRAAITENTKVLFGESISNAANLLFDVSAVAALGREYGIPLVVETPSRRPTCSARWSMARPFLCTQPASFSPAMVPSLAASSSMAEPLMPAFTLPALRIWSPRAGSAVRVSRKSMVQTRSPGTRKRVSRRASAQRSHR